MKITRLFILSGFFFYGYNACAAEIVLFQGMARVHLMQIMQNQVRDNEDTARHIARMERADIQHRENEEREAQQIQQSILLSNQQRQYYQQRNLKSMNKYKAKNHGPKQRKNNDKKG